ncbi:MAG: hypothetical protein PSX80_17625 [bacterium]|nr:hypothetical protein [bacterium]
MRNFIIATVFFLVSANSLCAQEPTARLLDQFGGGHPCGDIMGRLDMLLSQWTENTEERIVVVYYSKRFRKTTKYGKNGEPNTTVLAYPHPEDGLNWAKGIPQYLMDRLTGGGTQPNNENQKLVSKLREETVFVNGGYAEQMEAEIWLVPRSAPDPAPSYFWLRESDVKFGAKKPYWVPRYYFCYEGQ